MVFSARYVSRFAKRSTLSGITFILLIVYIYLANPSLYLVNCTESYADGQIVSTCCSYILTYVDNLCRGFTVSSV